MNCKICGKALWRGRFAEVCDSCAHEETERRKAKAEAEANEKRQRVETDLPRLIVTTEATHSLAVDRRIGIVSGQCVFGLNLVKDLFAGVRDIVGGRSATIQKALKDAQDEALTELKVAAVELGADAVVAVSFTHTQMSSGAGTMIAVVATGTAIMLEAQSA